MIFFEKLFVYIFQMNDFCVFIQRHFVFFILLSFFSLTYIEELLIFPDLLVRTRLRFGLWLFLQLLFYSRWYLIPDLDIFWLFLGFFLPFLLWTLLQRPSRVLDDLDLGQSQLARYTFIQFHPRFKHPKSFLDIGLFELIGTFPQGQVPLLFVSENRVKLFEDNRHDSNNFLRI